MTSCLHARLSELVHCGSWYRHGNKFVIKLLMPSSVKVGSGHSAALPYTDKHNTHLLKSQMGTNIFFKLYKMIPFKNKMDFEAQAGNCILFCVC